MADEKDLLNNNNEEEDSTEDSFSDSSSSSDGGGGETTSEAEEEEKDANTASTESFENEETVGKILAHGQSVDDHDESSETSTNAEQSGDLERDASEIGAEPEIEIEEDVYLDDYLKGVELTGLTGVKASEAERDENGDIIKSQNNHDLPTTQEALELQKQRNERFAAGREDIPGIDE